MSLTEFTLIDRFFSRANTNPSTLLGVGDDCALISIPEGYHLAITTDTMVEGVHFFPNTDPEALGHKLLAVNLSDLASMGAKPIAVTLSLTLPKIDQNWLTAFAKGFFNLADRYSVDLIGGDTTSGPLTLGVQAMGLVAKHQALTRSAAQPGDHIYMTGNLGDAGLGLKILQGYQTANPDGALARFHRPEPACAAALKLLGVANACIDISDGLTGDLGHVLKKSQVGACLDWTALPLSAPVLDYIRTTGDWQMPLTAGDDYELCFTVSPERCGQLDVAATQIGVIEKQPGLRLQRFGIIETLETKSFEHFF